ncbi:MAG: GntR family transcriptional regulator [Pseudonocardiaceae bacterium]
MALDLDDPRPTYLQLADRLRRAVAEGEYQHGDRLPAVRTLAQEFGVATATAAKAVDVLRREGIVVSRPGLGTVVRDPAAAAAAPTVQEQLDDLRRRVEALEARPSEEA